MFEFLDLKVALFQNPARVLTGSVTGLANGLDFLSGARGADLADLAGLLPECFLKICNDNSTIFADAVFSSDAQHVAMQSIEEGILENDTLPPPAPNGLEITDTSTKLQIPSLSQVRMKS